MGGGLTDSQLKEFDAYLNGASAVSDNDDVSLSGLDKEISDDEKNIKKTDINYLDKIIELHTQKADDIIKLLDKIDAKAHKDIVADLVDEMQYQKGVVKREKEQLNRLKQLFAQAAEAAK